MRAPFAAIVFIIIDERNDRGARAWLSA